MGEITDFATYLLGKMSEFCNMLENSENKYPLVIQIITVGNQQNTLEEN